MSCWTLWQRMPPRYQLTMRDSRSDDEVDTPQATASASRASSAGPRSPRLRTPRGARRGGSARARLSGDGAVLTSGVKPEDYPSEAEPGPQAPVLVPRSSPYIHNMKNQMRINSARRKMVDGNFSGTTNRSSSTTTSSYTPKARATTAPAFPVTSPSNTHEYHRQTSPRSPRLASPSPQPLDSPRSQSLSSLRQQLPQGGFSGRRSPKRPSSGCASVDTRRLSVSNIAPFGEQRDFRAEGQNPRIRPRSSPRQQGCVIGDYQVAALYVDKGRVTFFRKTKPDVTQSVYSAMSPYQVTRDDGSYLSHLRKAYLSGVRDLPKTSRREPELERHATIKERMDYDRKVGRILDYYAKVDIPREVHAPRPPGEHYQKQQSSPFPPPCTAAGRQGFRTLSARRRALRATAVSEVKGPQQSFSSSEGTEFTSPRGSLSDAASSPRGQGTHLQLNGSRADGFVRINSRVRLHDRHRFYLRTPTGADPASPRAADQQDQSGCVCGMCRLEMEVALMAQLHRDLGVSVDSLGAAQIRANLEGGDAATSAAFTANAFRGHQNAMGGVAEESTACPTRPNSVSESRCSTDQPDGLSLSKDVGPAAGPKTPSASQLPGRADAVTTSTQTPPATEASSLSVTLPVIEEVSEAAQTDRAAKAEVSEATDDSRTAVTSQPSGDTVNSLAEQCQVASAVERQSSKGEEASVEKNRSMPHGTVDTKSKQSDPNLNDDSVSPAAEEADTAKISEPVPDARELMPEHLAMEEAQPPMDNSKSNDYDERISEEPTTGTLDEENNNVVFEQSGNAEVENPCPNADCNQNVETMDVTPDAAADDSVPEIGTLSAADADTGKAAKGEEGRPEVREEREGGGGLVSAQQLPQIVVSAASDGECTSSDEQ